MEDKVSIIVPMYNVEKYIEKCINSILKQNYTNIEVLLVDDCATDSTGKIAEEIASRDNRCVYIKKEKNGGLAAARNTGIKNATGDYIVFIDSDDWISPNYVSKLIKSIKENDSDIAICDYSTVNETGEEKVANSLYPLNENSTNEEKVAYIRNHAVTKMFKKDFFNKIGYMFPEELKRAEDMGTTIPLLTKTEKIAIINEPLYYYLQRNNSISNDSTKKLDLTFYDNAFKVMVERSDEKYLNEIEYHGILEMIYGKTMLMLSHGYSNKEVKEHLKTFDKQFPRWRKNKYIKNLITLKKLFVKLAALKLVNILKVMVFINEKRK